MLIGTDNLQVKAGKKVLLSQLSIRVEPGELVAVLGENGAGKTSLIRALAGAIPSAVQQVYFKGRALGRWSVTDLATQRSVFQQFNSVSFPLTARELVSMGRFPYERHEPASLSRHLSSLALDRVAMLPLAEESMLVLSGGEQQRVHLARVFNQLYESEQTPCDKLLLLDEPLNNLDLRYRHLAMEWARALAMAGNGVVAVLHDINLALAYATRLVLIKQGRILADGPAEEVLSEELLTHCFDFPAQLSPMGPHGPVVHFVRQLQVSP